jgi:serine/threonine protein phosphatase PrpC
MTKANTIGIGEQECLSGESHWEVRGVAERGLRERLEDCWVAGTSTGFGSDLAYAAVFDGVGGLAQGDEASATAAQVVAEVVALRWPNAHPQELVKEALGAANEAVTELGGPATTAVLLVVASGIASVGWVGDSRALVFNTTTGSLRLITSDHKALHDEHDAPHEVITRWLGQGEACAPEFATLRLDPGDSIVLLTDGVHGVLEANQIAELLTVDGAGCQPARVVAAALDAGSLDNCTCVLMRPLIGGNFAVGDPGPEPESGVRDRT